METATKERKMSRTDTHRPSLLDPAEYTFKAAFYQGSSETMYDCYAEDHKDYDTARGEYPVFSGNHAAKTTCDHCGAAFAHGVLFLHIPTGELVHIGHICAENTVGLPSKAAAAKKRAENAAREENDRIKRHEASAKWQAENQDIIEFLNSQMQAEADYRNWNEEHPDAGHPRDNGPRRNPFRAPHPFILDMIHTFNKWGNLSERQAAATRKFAAKAAEFAARDAEKAPEVEPETPLAEGRVILSGVIVHTKWSEDNGYGSQPKMIVKLTDGNKVFGTVPEAAFREGYDLSGMKGLKVEFKATVERSRDDEHFGFYKRPTNITITEEVSA